MYFSLIDPFWNTGMLFGIRTHYLINKIENVQSEAARIATSGTKSIGRLFHNVMDDGRK
jgi:hypothetical protein